jgi:hypothetical protein
MRWLGISEAGDRDGRERLGGSVPKRTETKRSTFETNALPVLANCFYVRVALDDFSAAQCTTSVKHWAILDGAHGKQGNKKPRQARSR